ncbi:MAG: VanZ family protein [Clostridia bacterium]|nr:VanZ family protein [Clostridia bacterium]
MSLNANSLSTNILVTVLVLLMVFLLPWADRRICRKLRLNLQGGVSKNPRADALLRLRQGILYAILGLYLLALMYLVLLSRTAADEHQVHVALYQDLQDAITVDFGLLYTLRMFFTDGPAAAFSHIRVVSPANIAQVYMNIMLFVPMGYLLPYVSRWFRNRVRLRPVLACFLISFAVENLQLIFRLGLYDVDDLVSNTLGGLAGQFMYIAAGYVVTHPSWKKEIRSYRRWKKHAWKSTLYPFSRRIAVTRVTLLATHEEEVWDFYVTRLGFRPVRQLVPLESPETDLLLEMGRMQVEIHCLNRLETLEPQTLNLTVSRLGSAIRRLKANGIETQSPQQDPYNGLRCIFLQGPDNVRIRIIEG